MHSFELGRASSSTPLTDTCAIVPILACAYATVVGPLLVLFFYSDTAWFQDEMRVGQKNKLTYRWARKGSRPRAAHDQRTQSTYLFGAVCPERGAGAALVLPACNCEAMQLHLDEIATKVAPGAHAILLLDQAGWHGAKALVVPSNVSLVPLPPVHA
jgi:DDE superfamily endonuclease